MVLFSEFLYIPFLLFLFNFFFRFIANYDANVFLYCPEPAMKSKLLNLIRPFNYSLWLGLILSIILVTFVMACTRKLGNLLDCNRNQMGSSPTVFIVVAALFSEIR